MSSEPALLHVWRHPRPEGAAGRCIGARTDLPVHWRGAQRLGPGLPRGGRGGGGGGGERLPHVVHSSPLRRGADVGRWLARWGWRHRQDPALLELDFGSWDGRAWAGIAKGEGDGWGG